MKLNTSIFPSAVALVLLVFVAGARGQTAANVSTLHIFTGTGTDGSTPLSELVQGRDGDFYGTTRGGGSHSSGTVFKIAPGGTPTTLYNFGDQSDDGSSPVTGLALGSDGNFYGTTGAGLGTIFRLTPAGALVTLHAFTSGGGSTDGSGPNALVLGSDGNFYGTTRTGGGTINGGTFFQMTPGGVLTVLHSFTGSGTEGTYPNAAVVEGSDGYFYGTTRDGGNGANVSNGGPGGTVFRATTAGAVTTLHDFTQTDANGAQPLAALIQGRDGNFYGTTSSSGGANGYGTVFRLTAAGALTTLHIFGRGNDGATPAAALVEGSDGYFYGTTELGGGDAAEGTAFRMSPAGAVTILHGFARNATDGGRPVATLVPGGDGYFYGTAYLGGSSDDGTVFKFGPPPYITSAVTATATQGKAFSYRITAGDSPASFDAIGLPTGLTLTKSTGLISGTPKNAGTAAVTLNAINAFGTGSVRLTLTITAAPPVITSADTAAAQVGKAFSYQITATNNPTSYSTPGLPTGLSLDTSTGLITGTPKNAGTAAVTVDAINAAGTGSEKLTITIQAPPVITSATTASATVGQAFSYQITATNSPTSFTAPGLPTGLTLNATTGLISGAPKNTGKAAITISATNAAGTGSAKLTLTIAAP